MHSLREKFVKVHNSIRLKREGTIFQSPECVIVGIVKHVRAHGTQAGSNDENYDSNIYENVVAVRSKGRESPLAVSTFSRTYLNSEYLESFDNERLKTIEEEVF